MTSEIDVWRSAHLMIQQHDDDAVIEASTPADQILNRGEIKDRAVLLRIFRVIEELRRREVEEGGCGVDFG